MNRPRAIFVGLLSLATASLAKAALDDDLTTDNTGRAAFNQPFGFIKDEALDRFRSGASIFRQPWLTSQSEENPRFGGLGPLSNRLSCIGCHIGNGRGEPSGGEEDVMRTSLVRLSIPGTGPHGEPVPEPSYGDQLQPAGIYGVSGEGDASLRWHDTLRTLPDGTQVPMRQPEIVFSRLHYGPMAPATMASVRMTPAVFGLGLVAAVPDEELTALAENGHDGIHGRLNYVWDLENQRVAIGRFGLKANQPTLRQQVAAALMGDMGITSAVFPQQNCTLIETDCLRAPANSRPEIGDDDLSNLVAYVERIAPPARRSSYAASARGEMLFSEIGCASCHVPTLRTGRSARMPQIAGREIHPFTDLLLHDMGEELADGRPDFDAGGRDWRTAPLWGIGLADVILGQATYLHDGRARNLNEAILWHGGDSEKTRNTYAALSAPDREAVIAFLKTL